MADGVFHKVAGQDYFDEAKVTVVDPMTVRYAYRKGGRQAAESKDSASAGESYDAKVGGPAVPLKGDPGKSMVAVRMPDAGTVEETTARDGKVANVSSYSVAADVVTMSITSHDPRDDATTTLVAKKQ